VANTGEVGPIKIIRSERIQDGVERLIYCSGDEAVRFIQKRFGQMQKASDELGVSPDQLEQAVQKFFGEWKERGKEIERIKKDAGKAIAEGQKSVSIRGLRGIFIHIPDSEMPELVEAGKKLSKENSIVVLTGGMESGIVLALCDDKALSHGFDAVTLADRVAKELGGKAGGNKKEAKGGGKNIGRIEQSLEKIKKELTF
jgi:alanyl-tRNA synthetase